MVIQGKNVLLRHLKQSDIPRMLEWGRDPELHRLMEGNYPDTVEEYEEWLGEVRSDRHRQVFGVTTVDDLLIGDIELVHIAWRSGDAELRVRIGDGDFRGRGYGTEAVALLLQYAFGPLNLRRIYLRVFQFNRRAIASYRKVGFKTEGAIVRATADGARARIVLMRIFRHEFLPASGKTPQGIVVDM